MLCVCTWTVATAQTERFYIAQEGKTASIILDAEDSKEFRDKQRLAIAQQCTEDFRNGTYKRGGGVIPYDKMEEFFAQYLH